MTNRHLWILVACEAMAYCLMAIILSVSAVSGYFLAPVRSLALLPLITEVLGSCVSTIPAAYLMKKHGRRIGFLVGSAVGVVGSLLCFYAIYTNNFWLLVASTPLLGVLTGFGEYTRYAAADLFDDERRKSRAISFVVCSGIVAAFVGPSLANWSNELTNVRFAGAYLACLALCLISFVLFWFYQDPAQQVEDDTAAPVATWREVIRAPLFVVGTMSGVAAFLTMAVLMDATPIVMLEGGYHFSHTTEVIQWHLLAMFAPSLFTGRLIEKLGVLKTIYLGIGLGALGIVIGLAGTDYFNFLISLILVGLSWNFMYVAGTALVAHIPKESRSTAEGASNFLMSASFALATPIAAAITLNYGWVALCISALVPLAATVGAGLYFSNRRDFGPLMVSLSGELD